MIPPTLFFLAILIPLPFHTVFRISLIVSIKILLWFWSYGSIWEELIFVLLNLPIHKHSMSLHLFSSLISFFKFFLLFCHKAPGILVPQPGIEPTPLAVEVWSLNHWTSGEVPGPFICVLKFSAYSIVYNCFTIYI